MTRSPFEDELVSRLKVLADQAPTTPSRTLASRSSVVEALANRRSKRWSLAAAAAVVTMVIGGGLALASRDGDKPSAIVTTPGPVSSEPDGSGPDTSAPTVTAPDSGADGHWSEVGLDWWELPEGTADGRVFPTEIWTGDELIIWGGETQSETTWSNTGAAFNPSAGQWRDLADSPLSPRSEHSAVWTGSEMLVCCGRAPNGDGRTAAAYDPAIDYWRTLAPPPFETAFAGSVWTGSEMLVVGGAQVGAAGDVRAAAAYDPAADSWRMLTEPPATIERNADIVFADGHLVVATRQYAPATFMIYVMATDVWEMLPTPPPALAINGSSMVFTGTELVIWGVSPMESGDAIGARLLLGDDHWVQIVDDPLPRFEGYEGNVGSMSAVWTGAEMVVFTGALGNHGLNNDGPTAVLAYDPRSDSWRSLPDTPTGGYHPSMLWTGEVVVLGSSVAINPAPPRSSGDRGDSAGELPRNLPSG